MAANQGHLPRFVSGAHAYQDNLSQRRMRCHPPADELIQPAKALRNEVGVPVVVFRVLKRNAHDLARRYFGDLSTRREVVTKRSLGDDNMNRGFSQRPDRARQTKKENRNESLHWSRSASEEYGYLRAVGCYGPLIPAGWPKDLPEPHSFPTTAFVAPSEKAPQKRGFEDYWTLALQAAAADVLASVERNRAWMSS